MKLFFWKKDEASDTGAYAPYEEIDSKQTSRLGYFFLILMVLFGVWQGNNFLSAVQDSVTRPTPNSYCSSTIRQHTTNQTDEYPYGYSTYDYEYSTYGYGALRPFEACAFTEREKMQGLDVAYRELYPLLVNLNELASGLTNLNNQLNSAQIERNRSVNDYQVSVVEDIAYQQSGGVFDSAQLGSGVVSQDSVIAALNEQIRSTTAAQDDLTQNIRSIASRYVNALERVDEEYAQEMRIYELKQFFLSIVFIIPVFFFVWRRYGIARLNRSEYAVIWGGAVATFGFILAQVLLVFVYEILPHRLLQAVFAFLQAFSFLWALLYWFGFVLVPLFFGGLIYLIQKKFYNKRAVMMRALKSGHCPHCSLTINLLMNNCPVCGYELKSKCEACGSMSMSGGSFCEACGSRRGQTGAPAAPQSE